MRSKECWAATSVVLFATLVGGCKPRSSASSGPGDAGDGSAAAYGVVFEAGPFLAIRIPDDSGPAASGIPVPVSKVESTLNPQRLPPYTGPTATIEGVVTVSGDPVAKREITIPFACGEAYATYGKVAREGTGRTLADAMIAVTRYQGFVPAKGDDQPVKIHGCAFDRRTVVLTYGQHLEVFNTDPKTSYLPTLVGANMPAQMAAMPHGDAVKLYPNEVGHYVLSDDAKHDWMYADVFVVPFPTHAVTGLDGRYRIEGIPAGTVKVSMYAPVIDAQLHPDFGIESVTQEREIELKAGETTKIDFVLPYKTPKPKPKPKIDPDRPIVK
jgi:hypothetical protein